MSSFYSTIPGYDETRAALDAAKRLPLPTARAHLAETQAADDIAAMLRAGHSVDADTLLEVARGALNDVDTVRVARGAITTLRERLQADLDNLVATNPDAILAGLNAALRDLVAQAKSLQPLDEILTERDAIASDRAADFTALHALASPYAQIRREQLRILRDTGIEDGLEVAMVRNVRDVFPAWAPWRTHGFLVHDTTRTRSRTIVEPWPAAAEPGNLQSERAREVALPADRSRALGQAAQQLGFLVWAVRAGAQLWVPTLPQLAAANRDAQAALARDQRQALIDGEWLDPGSIDLGTPARSGAHGALLGM